MELPETNSDKLALAENSFGTQRTAKQLQQDLGELFGGKNIIPWDLYNANDKRYLIRKLEYIFPDNPGTDAKAEKENRKMQTLRDTVAEAVWNQRKYSGGNLLMSISYVVLTEYTENKKSALEATKYELHPLFRVRKCQKGEDSVDCCMIFIDENGRVYKDWEDYVTENTLREGILVAPLKGYYDFDGNNVVRLELSETPASSILAKAGNVVNVAAGVLGLGAAGVAIAATAVTVAAPVAIGATVVGIGSGICSAISSVTRLVNRGTHEECINITNSQARADWIGFVGGVAGLGASGASTALARYASTGRNVSTIARGAVNGINVATIAINGVGVGNGAVEIIWKLKNKEEISAMDIAQFGASLFLVTHSVYNFKTASQIVRSSMDKAILSAQEQLSNRQRKAFNRALKRTILLRGDTQGKMDVIRALNSMPDSKQPLNDLFKINKQMNEHGMTASFNPDGSILINNELTVDSGTLRQNLQHGIGDSIPARLSSTPINPPENFNNRNVVLTQSNTNMPLSTVSIRVLASVAINTAATVQAAIGDADTFEECVSNILRYVSENGLRKLINVATDFLANCADRISEGLGRLIPIEEVLWKTYEIVRDWCGNKNLEEFIKYFNPTQLLQNIKEYYENMLPISGKKYTCSKCGGKYSICRL